MRVMRATRVFMVVVSMMMGLACGDSSSLSNNPTCGNSIAELGEVCDGTDLGDQTCEAMGLAPGVLSCTEECGLDASGCGAVPPNCGNHVANEGESCDGTDLRGQTCVQLGQEPGILACSTICTYDFSNCGGVPPECGNDIAEVGELCDGTDMKGADCQDIGLPYGVLACTETCVYDISACYSAVPECGNGIVENGEECDDGNHDVTDACPDGPEGTCQNARCGDGFVWDGVEGCDDGNEMNGDLCPDGPGGTCELAECGDGFLQVGVEVCDPGIDPMCNPDCQGSCGDGIVQSEYEVCDLTQSGCNWDCKGTCHDSVFRPGFEECDIGLGDWACNFDCTLAICGDGVCEVGDFNSGCTEDCYCGNGTCEDFESHGWGGETSENCPQDCG